MAFWPAIALTGGASGALDNIDGALLSDGDVAIVVTGSQAYTYHLDATSAGAESSPNIITPDVNAGDKRWLLQGAMAGSLKSTTTTGKITITGPAAGATRAITVPDADCTMATTTTKLDDFAAPDDNTDLNASTTAHGLVVKATAPAAGLYNYVGITNGETAYTNKALFDATNPTTQAFSDAAVVGSATAAARRDHKHAMMAEPTTVSGNAGSATVLQTTRAIYGNNFDGSAELTQIIAGTYGGTGVNNSTRTITYAGNVAFTGAYNVNFTMPGAYTYTYPSATSTLAALGVAQSWTADQTFKELTETVYTITDGAAFEIDPANGTIQTITLTASRTPAATNFASGQFVILRIADGTAYTITWTTIGVVWAGGVAPTLAATGYTHVVLWKNGSTVYGSALKDVAS